MLEVSAPNALGHYVHDRNVLVETAPFERLALLRLVGHDTQTLSLGNWRHFPGVVAA